MVESALDGFSLVVLESVIDGFRWFHCIHDEGFRGKIRCKTVFECMLVLAQANVITHSELGLQCYTGSTLIDTFEVVSTRCRHVLGLNSHRPMFRIVLIGD